MLYELNYDLLGESGERRADYARLEERICDVGDALWVESSTWMVEASLSLPMIDAYLHAGLRAYDRLRVFPATKVMTADGLTDEQKAWMTAHGVRLYPRSPFAVAAVAGVERQIQRKKALVAAALAARARHAAPPSPGPFARIVAATNSSQAPTTDWLSALLPRTTLPPLPLPRR